MDNMNMVYLVQKDNIDITDALITGEPKIVTNYINVFFTVEDTIKYLLELAEDKEIIDPYKYKLLVDIWCVSECHVLYIRNDKFKFTAYSVWVKHKELPEIMKPYNDYKSIQKVNAYTYPSIYHEVKGAVESATGIAY